jgi:Tol biopolymer transport system component
MFNRLYYDIFVLTVTGPPDQAEEDGSAKISNEPVNLTNDPAKDLRPAWSPQGGLLAFRSGQNERFQIYIVQTAAAGLRRLLFTEANDDQPAWSPDGRQIAFISNRALGSEGRRSRQPSPPYALYVFNLDARETKLVAGEGGIEFRYQELRPTEELAQLELE